MSIDTELEGNNPHVVRTTRHMSLRMQRPMVSRLDTLRAEFDRRVPPATATTRTAMIHLSVRAYLEHVRRLQQQGQFPERPLPGFNPDNRRDLISVGFRMRTDYLDRIDSLCRMFDKTSDNDIPTARSDVLHEMVGFTLSEVDHAVETGDDDRLRHMHYLSKDW